MKSSGAEATALGGYSPRRVGDPMRSLEAGPSIENLERTSALVPATSATRVQRPGASTARIRPDARHPPRRNTTPTGCRTSCSSGPPGGRRMRRSTCAQPSAGPRVRPDRPHRAQSKSPDDAGLCATMRTGARVEGSGAGGIRTPVPKQSAGRFYACSHSSFSGAGRRVTISSTTLTN